MLNTLLLGSGFSAGAGLPTMKRFGEAFWQMSKESTAYPNKPTEDVLGECTAEYPWLIRISANDAFLVSIAVRYAVETMRMEGDTAFDLEWLIAHFDMLHSIGLANNVMSDVLSGPVDQNTSRVRLSDCYRALKSSIHKIYRTPLKPVESNGPLCKCIKSFDPRYIITTNWDRATEVVLDKAGFKWSHWPEPNATLEPGVVGVVKIHGDTLWTEETQPKPPLEERKPGQRRKKLRHYRIRKLVLPTWVRQRPAANLGITWKTATEAILQAEHFAIIGFGLAVTDQHIEHLLTAGLKAQAFGAGGPRKITIINPDPVAINRILVRVPPAFKSRVVILPARIEDLF